MDEAERMLAISKASHNAANEGQDDGEQEKKRTPTTSSFLGEGDLTPSWSSDWNQHDPFCFGIQAYIGSKTRLQRTGRISSNRST